MEWTSDAILLAGRPQGENSVIVDLLTAEHGRHLGLVRGGAGRKLAPILQVGAQLQVHWRARLSDQLGACVVEPIRARAAGVLGEAERLMALSSVCALAAWALPEREPQPRLYPATYALLDAISSGEAWRYGYLAWELLLLEETGFGLELAQCALTGARENLAYVSPITGRAATLEAGAPWAEKLLPLPSLLSGPAREPSARELGKALALTGHFLTTVLAPALGERPVPAARGRLVDRLTASREA